MRANHVAGWRYQRFSGGWHVHTLRRAGHDRGHVTFLPRVGRFARVYLCAVIVGKVGALEFTHEIGERRTCVGAKRLLERTLDAVRDAG